MNQILHLIINLFTIEWCEHDGIPSITGQYTTSKNVSRCSWISLTMKIELLRDVDKSPSWGISLPGWNILVINHFLIRSNEVVAVIRKWWLTACCVGNLLMTWGDHLHRTKATTTSAHGQPPLPKFTKSLTVAPSILSWPTSKNSTFRNNRKPFSETFSLLTSSKLLTLERTNAEALFFARLIATFLKYFYSFSNASPATLN